MQHIQIDIGPDGGIRIEAQEFSGPDCEQATAFLEEALGQVGRRNLKPEYHTRRTVRRSQNAGRGDCHHAG